MPQQNPAKQPQLGLEVPYVRVPNGDLDNVYGSNQPTNPSEVDWQAGHGTAAEIARREDDSDREIDIYWRNGVKPMQPEKVVGTTALHPHDKRQNGELTLF